MQQTGKVNKGIMQTIRNAPEMFLPYNNGLAATALDVQTEMVKGQLFITSMRDFQIVNGGQTTASLFHTDRKHKVDLVQGLRADEVDRDQGRREEERSRTRHRSLCQ
ncbi:MAG: AIPR family protein [Flavobacteriales bacterium]|nr:AIPR family protein [Flavobacteriales bacterium]